MRRPSAHVRMGPAELVQAAAMARRFYLEGKSKIQIAEEFGVSRFKVARVLETALERDLVRIEIRVPAELDAERSDALRARYGLRHAVVVESPAGGQADDAADPENLGEVAADLLGELVTEGDVLGPGLGPVDHPHGGRAATGSPPCTVVQLTGVYDAGTAERGSVEAVRARGRRSPAARRTRSTRRCCCPTRRPPPRCAARRGIARGLRVLRQGHRRRASPSAPGSRASPPSTTCSPTQEREHYASLGVAAEMSAHLFDAEGRRIGRDLGERCITVEADRLRRIPEVVAIAGGRRKAAAIGAVLRSGLVTSLVTDTAAADYLLTAGPAPSPRWTGRTPTASGPLDGACRARGSGTHASKLAAAL